MTATRPVNFLPGQVKYLLKLAKVKGFKSRGQALKKKEEQEGSKCISSIKKQTGAHVTLPSGQNFSQDRSLKCNCIRLFGHLHQALWQRPYCPSLTWIAEHWLKAIPVSRRICKWAKWTSFLRSSFPVLPYKCTPGSRHKDRPWQKSIQRKLEAKQQWYSVEHIVKAF